MWLIFAKKTKRDMKQISITLLCCLLTLAAYAQGGKPLTLKDVVTGTFRVENIYGVIPIPGDGEHYSQMNAEGTQIIKYSFKTGKQVEVLFDAATARECPFKRFDSYSFSPDGSMLLIATETTNNVVEKLSDGGPQQVPVFSPDGSMVAFVRDNNIFLVKRYFGNSESQVTKDGERNKIIYGTPDWVYEEEFSYNRALEFSADTRSSTARPTGCTKRSSPTTAPWSSAPTARCWPLCAGTRAK